MPHRDSAPAGAPTWVDLSTADPAGARAFYTELFGWTAEDPNPEFGGYFNFQKDGVRIAGCMGSDGSAGVPDMWSVYLSVADAQATEAAAVANGGQIYAPTMAVGDLGTMLVMADAGGAAVGAWQPGEHAGFHELGEPGAPSWFEVLTRDYDATLAFYRTVFGWDIHTMSDTPEFRYSTFGEGDDALAGIMDGSGFLPEGVPAHWSVYFGTEDTDKAVVKVAELGGAVVDEPTDTPYGRLATVTDPTGARFKLVQP